MFTRCRFLTAAALSLLLTLIVLTASLLFADSHNHAPLYDTNGNGIIDSEEAYQALQDYYYAGTLTQEQTQDILFRYWGDVPVSVLPPEAPATSTPTPLPAYESPTPSPQPTPEPTPVAMTDTYGNGCAGREVLPSTLYAHTYNGAAAADIRIVAVFQNPSEPDRQPWEAPELPEFWYGFMVRSVPSQNIGLLILVSSNKTWHVELRRNYAGYVYEARHGSEYQYDRLVQRHRQGWGHAKSALGLDEGSLEGSGISFNVGPQDTNHLMFEAKGNVYTLAVNGQTVPLSVDAEDVQALEEQIGQYRHHDDGQWHGNYNLTYYSPDLHYGGAYPTTGGTYAKRERGGSTLHSPYPWAACVP